jgi:hypothetical protein
VELNQKGEKMSSKITIISKIIDDHYRKKRFE